ncbi:hypothetical protein EJ06DRAFT_91148 [Trichodelitschia bisporula]|uniref:Microbial-type PARG catalytic domain-containing protein n=1 Tax=Trichodelitschia bisporula TaxID=703511 RepID=A0A6G1HSE8_9PEZI|nr:hypothetical protein EJ06DRAFT_91148 [Trichodelitschia bisporula]
MPSSPRLCEHCKRLITPAPPFSPRLVERNSWVPTPASFYPPRRCERRSRVISPVPPLPLRPRECTSRIIAPASPYRPRPRERRGSIPTPAPSPPPPRPISGRMSVALHSSPPVRSLRERRNIVLDPADADIPLAQIAQETVDVMESYCALYPDLDLARSQKYSADLLPPLTFPEQEPFPPVPIRVMQMDTLDAAIALTNLAPPPSSPAPVCVLNFANALVPGGGWLHGSRAQEEALCYRSTLFLSLHEAHYPLDPLTCIHTPAVAIFRTSMGDRHYLLPHAGPQPPLVAAITDAAAYRPLLAEIGYGVQGYANRETGLMVREKMRMVLRVAARNGNRRLVLGAIGCGQFGHPAREVAKAWAHVLREPEWRGWFEYIWFAVLNGAPGGPTEDNFEVFQRELDGKEINTGVGAVELDATESQRCCTRCCCSGCVVG